MKISYLITCSTETDTLVQLLKRVKSFLENDEIIILMDEKYVNEKNETYNIVEAYHHLNGGRLLSHKLDNDYGSHKNFGIEHCSGDFVFQLDGDELPSELTLGENLKSIIESNPTIECFLVPRLNDFIGVKQEHALQWGWKLTPSKTIIHEKIIDTNSDEYKFLKNGGYILEETDIL